MLLTLTANFHRLGTAALLTLALLVCQHLSTANPLESVKSSSLRVSAASWLEVP